MALNVSGYVDPGVLVGEVNTPSGISVATVPDILGITAYGNRKKRSINEAVQRGKISDEAISLASVAPHTSTLVNRGDRRISNTTIRRTLNNQTIDLPDSAINYLTANLLGSDAGPYDLTTNNAIGIKVDGGKEITMTFTDGVAAVVITGSLVEVTTPLTTSGGAATRAEVVVGINAGLAAAAALGYGLVFATVASDDTTGIKLTSPTDGPYSDVQILEPFANDATAALGFTTPAKAVTTIEVDTTFYNASATYKIDYVALDSLIDALQSAATDIVRVGYFAGVRTFVQPTDYLLLSGDIDWSPNTAATFTGAIAGTFDLTVNDVIRIAVDGKAAVNIDLNGMASPPPGYTDPVAIAAVTAAEIANNVNAVLSTTLNYGPMYIGVASDDGGKVKLTSPSESLASDIEIAEPASNDATTAIFGLATNQLPYIVMGTGNTPAIGSLYFATYEYARPTTDYNTPKRYFSEDAMIQDLTPVSAENRLSMLGQIAYDNDAPSIIVSQIDDASTPGFPIVNEVSDGLEGLERTSLITDVVMDDTRLNSQVLLVSHIENQSSVTEKQYRSGWFGMPIGTDVGDKDTPDTFVYRSAVTLQVGPDSPGRGRLFLVAPTGVNRVITNEDGSSTTLTLDSIALATAIAAKHTSFTSPAISLAGKTIIGFDVNTFPVYLKAERAQLASNGTCVVTNVGGRLELLDPLSTEAGGGKLQKFMYRSLSSQKDNVTRSVDKAIDRNLRGVVPDDLADFIFDIKIIVGAVLTSLIEAGAIGPFRDANGVSRDIDLSKDVQAEQSKSDPTKFFFKYFYFLRYPALRFFGEFSVDNPFF